MNASTASSSQLSHLIDSGINVSGIQFCSKFCILQKKSLFLVSLSFSFSVRKSSISNFFCSMILVKSSWILSFSIRNFAQFFRASFFSFTRERNSSSLFVNFLFTRSSRKEEIGKSWTSVTSVFSFSETLRSSEKFDFFSRTSTSFSVAFSGFCMF